MDAISRLSPAAAQPLLAGLVDLLVDSVDGGASVGFLPPMQPAEARAFWEHIFEEMARGERDLWAAFEDGRLVGSVQLGYVSKPNGLHRAEVQKLLVHSSFRRNGLGRRLMQHAEEHARGRGLRLLVLDTIKGDAAEQLYPQLGFQRAGEIPAFARSASGELEATVVFYKLLES